METRRVQSAPASPVLFDELLVEILSWLPVKPLLRFKCVCKLWNSVISNPKFVKLHLQRSPKNANLLLLSEYFPDDYEDGSDFSAVTCSVRCLLENPSSPIAEDNCYRLKDNYCRDVIGSCNGLVCLVGYIVVIAFQEYWLYFWNPATRLRSEQSACLCFEGGLRYGITKFAFGYDNLSGTYKVVAFRLDREAKEESQKSQVRVYSLGDDCWRDIQGFPVVPFTVAHVPAHNDGVYLSGTLNWLALRNFIEDYRWKNTTAIGQWVIVSLDLGKETYRQLLPPLLCLDEVPYVEPTLGVLMECLCFSHDSKRTHFVVWQMKEFGVQESWTQFLNISYHDLQFDYSKYRLPLLPLCMSENGDVLIMATADELQAILYNWRDNKVERTEIPGRVHWTNAKDYVESLVLPCCN